MPEEDDELDRVVAELRQERGEIVESLPLEVELANLLRSGSDEDIQRACSENRISLAHRDQIQKVLAIRGEDKTINTSELDDLYQEEEIFDEVYRAALHLAGEKKVEQPALLAEKKGPLVIRKELMEEIVHLRERQPEGDLPAEALKEIQERFQTKLNSDERNETRSFLLTHVLSQVEAPRERRGDVRQTFEIMHALFGPEQGELAHDLYALYGALYLFNAKKYALPRRYENDPPWGNMTNIVRIRTRFNEWLKEGHKVPHEKMQHQLLDSFRRVTEFILAKGWPEAKKTIAIERAMPGQRVTTNELRERFSPEGYKAFTAGLTNELSRTEVYMRNLLDDIRRTSSPYAARSSLKELRFLFAKKADLQKALSEAAHREGGVTEELPAPDERYTYAVTLMHLAAELYSTAEKLRGDLREKRLRAKKMRSPEMQAVQGKEQGIVESNISYLLDQAALYDEEAESIFTGIKGSK